MLVLVWRLPSGHDSGAAVIASMMAKVTYADADKVEVRREDGSQCLSYSKFVVLTQELHTTKHALLRVAMS